MHVIQVNALEMEVYKIFFRMWGFSLLLLVLTVCQLDVNSDAAIISGLEEVPSCPATTEEWEVAERKKNCGSQKIEANVLLKYHCLLNHWRNTTYELCGEGKLLNGYRCPEFNEKGSQIQENWITKCDKADPPCPFKWNSKDVFKYPNCIRLNETQIKRKLDTDDTNWSSLYIASPFLALLLALCIYLLVKTCINKIRMEPNEPNTTEEVILPLVNPDRMNLKPSPFNN